MQICFKERSTQMDNVHKLKIGDIAELVTGERLYVTYCSYDWDGKPGMNSEPLSID